MQSTDAIKFHALKMRSHDSQYYSSYLLQKQLLVNDWSEMIIREGLVEQMLD